MLSEQLKAANQHLLKHRIAAPRLQFFQSSDCNSFKAAKDPFLPWEKDDYEFLRGKLAAPA
jgi:hypothetical protein